MLDLILIVRTPQFYIQGCSQLRCCYIFCSYPNSRVLLLISNVKIFITKPPFQNTVVQMPQIFCFVRSKENLNKLCNVSVELFQTNEEDDIQLPNPFKGIGFDDGK